MVNGAQNGTQIIQHQPSMNPGSIFGNILYSINNAGLQNSVKGIFGIRESQISPQIPFYILLYLIICLRVGRIILTLLNYI